MGKRLARQSTITIEGSAIINQFIAIDFEVNDWICEKFTKDRLSETEGKPDDRA